MKQLVLFNDQLYSENSTKSTTVFRQKRTNQPIIVRLEDDEEEDSSGFSVFVLRSPLLQNCFVNDNRSRNLPTNTYNIDAQQIATIRRLVRLFYLFLN